MSEVVFDIYSQYYDLLYNDKDYKKECEYINSLLNRFGVFKANILEFGSGTGKHGALLAELGYTVDGVELSEKMVRKIKAHPRFTCVQGDISKINLGKSFDIILSLFHVMNYQTTNDQLKLVFANAARHLNSKGLFIFDFWYSPAVYANRPSVKIKRVRNKKIEIIRIAEPTVYDKKKIVDVNYLFFVENLATGSIKKFNEVHKVRHFNLSEIKNFADMQGFELINSEEFITGSKLSNKTWSGCVALKKK
jgi:SAM-dependent methyltransferase